MSIGTDISGLSDLCWIIGINVIPIKKTDLYITNTWVTIVK